MQDLGGHALQTQPAAKSGRLVQVSLVSSSRAGTILLAALLGAQKSWRSSPNLSLCVPSHMPGKVSMKKKTEPDVH